MDAFVVGRCRVEPARKIIARNGQEISVEPKVMDVLCSLVHRHGEVVDRITLLDEIWNDDEAADDSLTRAISLLRKAFARLDDDGDAKAGYIETIPRRGYRLVPSITAPPVEPSATPFPGFPAPADGLATEMSNPPRDRSWRWLALAIPVFVAILTAVAGQITWVTPRQTVAVPGVSDAQSVAVLPFRAMGPGEQNDLLALALSEEILNTLAAVEGLRVPGRTSSFAYKQADGKLADIRQTLGVAYVLEGGLQVRGENMRVTARLVDTRSGYNIWSDRFDRRLDDILRVQTEIAASVAQSLERTISSTAAEALLANTPADGAVYRLYLEGRQLLHRRGPHVARSIVRLEEAVSLDPKFARATGALASAHLLSARYMNIPTPIAHERARTRAKAALTLDPQLGEPAGVLAAIEGLTNNWARALTLFEQAERARTPDAHALMWHGEALMNLGFADKGLEKANAALAIEPRSGVVNLVVGNAYYLTGDRQAAERYYRRAISFGLPRAKINLSFLGFADGHYRSAAQSFAETIVLMQLVPADQLEPLTAFVLDIIRGEPTVDEGIDAFPALANDIDFRTILYLYAGEIAKALRALADDVDNDKGYFWTVWSDLTPGLREGENFMAFANDTGLVDYWRTVGPPDGCTTTDETAFVCR
ncbi:MAG: winged helix-turn-helix domain-containing protein [Pseudomonadota bacterium]